MSSVLYVINVYLYNKIKRLATVVKGKNNKPTRSYSYFEIINRIGLAHDEALGLKKYVKKKNQSIGIQSLRTNLELLIAYCTPDNYSEVESFLRRKIEAMEHGQISPSIDATTIRRYSHNNNFALKKGDVLNAYKWARDQINSSEGSMVYKVPWNNVSLDNRVLS